MEPRSPENLPSPIEQTPSSANGETYRAAEYERRQSPLEQDRNTLETERAPAVSLPTIQLPQPISTVPPVSSPQSDSDDIPTTAGDDDLIEKEWVDKSKKIIAETKDDPYQRERQVGKLQYEYLRKRYGKELGGDAAA